MIKSDVSHVSCRTLNLCHSCPTVLTARRYVHLPGVMSDEELKQDIDDVSVLFPTYHDAVGHHISHGQPSCVSLGVRGLSERYYQGARKRFV